MFSALFPTNFCIIHYCLPHPVRWHDHYFVNLEEVSKRVSRGSVFCQNLSVSIFGFKLNKVGIHFGAIIQRTLIFTATKFLISVIGKLWSTELQLQLPLFYGTKLMVKKSTAFVQHKISVLIKPWYACVVCNYNLLSTKM